MSISQEIRGYKEMLEGFHILRDHKMHFVELWRLVCNEVELLRLL
jgi:hypothetical protein